MPDFEPRQVTLRQWGRADAQVIFTGGLSTHLASTVRVQVGGATQGRCPLDPRMRGFWSQFNGLMEPLHFGNFAGCRSAAVFPLGLTPAFLAVGHLDLARRASARGCRAGNGECAMTVSSSHQVTLVERIFVGLHAMGPGGLARDRPRATVPARAVGSLAQRPAGILGAVVLWLVFGLLPALVLRRRLMLWRAALVFTALLLIAAAVAGIVLPSARLDLALVLAALGVASLALAWTLGPHRVREHRMGRGSPSKAVHVPSRSWWQRLHRGLPFWVAGGLMVEGFRFAHLTTGEPHRDSGLVAMVAAFFLLLPPPRWRLGRVARRSFSRSRRRRSLRGSRGVRAWRIGAGRGLVARRGDADGAACSSNT